MEEDRHNPPITPERRAQIDREEMKGCLLGLVIGSAMAIPLLTYSALRGIADGQQSAPPLENPIAHNLAFYGSYASAIIGLGQAIPFRFDNVDPGCLSTMMAIPLSVGLSQVFYNAGYSAGSMNR